MGESLQPFVDLAVERGKGETDFGCYAFADADGGRGLLAAVQILARSLKIDCYTLKPEDGRFSFEGLSKWLLGLQQHDGVGVLVASDLGRPEMLPVGYRETIGTFKAIQDLISKGQLVVFALGERVLWQSVYFPLRSGV